MNERELRDASERARDLCSAPALVVARRRRTVTTSPPSTVELFVLEVVAYSDGGTGRAKATGLAPDAIQLAVKRAEDAARSAPEPGPPGPPENAAPPRTHDGFDPHLATVSPADLASVLREATGELEARAEWTAVAGAGDVVFDAATAVRARVGNGAGEARGAAARLDALPLDLLVAEARFREAGVAGGAEPPHGEFPTVLSPEAVGTLLAALGRMAFNGLLHANGTGALAGRLGTRVAASAINLSDSPRFPGTAPRAIDAEGVAKAPRPLIQDGVAHGVVHDSRSAHRAGGAAASTGHALAPGGAPGGPEPRNLVLVGGGAAAEAELVSRVAHGVWGGEITDVEVLDARRAEIRAVVRGARLIAGGRLAGTLAPLRFQGSALDALSRADALSARPRLVGLGAHGVVAPAVLFAALPLGGIM